MTYRPHREVRFHDLWDLIHFIESNQCEACRFRKSPYDFDPNFATEFPMCPEVEADVISEEPVEALDDMGDQGVVCSRFKQGDPPMPEDPDQLVLGE
jgi:hypothetical protein